MDCTLKKKIKDLCRGLVRSGAGLVSYLIFSGLKRSNKWTRKCKWPLTDNRLNSERKKVFVFLGKKFFSALFSLFYSIRNFEIQTPSTFTCINLVVRCSLLLNSQLTLLHPPQTIPSASSSKCSRLCLRPPGPSSALSLRSCGGCFGEVTLLCSFNLL